MKEEAKLHKLIVNEYNKIILKKTTYIMLAICLLFGVGISLLITKNLDYDEDYTSNESIQDSIDYYSSSKDIYSVLLTKEYTVYKEMNYTYMDEVPGWVHSGVSESFSNHYTYVEYNSNSSYENSNDLENEINLDGIDLKYEEETHNNKINALKSLDYKSYFETYINYADKKMAIDKEYYFYNYDYCKYMLDKEVDPNSDTWRVNAFRQYSNTKHEYEDLVKSKEEGNQIVESDLANAEKSFKIHEYRLNNDYEYVLMDLYNEDIPVSDNKFITSLVNNSIMCGLAAVFIVIIAAGIFANEFSTGTIKFLLINPVKRHKIFWSKYITCISLLLISLVTFFIIHFLATLIFCGSSGIDGVYLNYKNGSVHETSIIFHAIKQYAITGLAVIPTVTLAFTISAFLRSSALAIALSLGIELAGSTITMFLYSFGHDWGRYLLFANTDFLGISNGDSLFPMQTLTFAIITTIIYVVVFLLTAYDGFTKKDV